MSTDASRVEKSNPTADSIDPLECIEYRTKTGKRATHENFEFAPGDGVVEVRNASHADADEHTYTVHLESGIPFSCSCPADEYHEGACKHRVALALSQPVIAAAEGGS